VKQYYLYLTYLIYHVDNIESFLLILGYRISDQVEFCDFDKPLSCKTENAPNSTSGTLVFEVDLKKRYFKDDNNVKIDAERIPVKLQREDCLCDWRLCNSGCIIVFKWQAIALSIIFILMFRCKIDNKSQYRAATKDRL
jgi:hypothetical protein